MLTGIKWGSFLVALLCLIGFFALLFSCEDENNNSENSEKNIGWDIINPLYWGEKGGCIAGKEITKWVGIGSSIVFVVVWGLQKIISPSMPDYSAFDHDYDD